MASVEPEVSVLRNLRASADTWIARGKGWFGDGSDHSLARRMAGSAFLIRVFSAGVTFLLHILLARWMGQFEFGIYVYVWTWLVLAGSLAPLGIAYAAQRFIPEYAAAREFDRLRGFLVGSRVLSFVFGVGVSLAGFALLHVFGDRIPAYYRVPFALALVCIPVFSLSSAQDGIARSYNWLKTALFPAFVAQPVLVLTLIAAAHVAGFPGAAVTAMAVTAGAFWLVVLVQAVLLQRRLAGRVEAGPRRYETGRWIMTAFPILLVDGFYLLLTYTDILVLQLFVDPGALGVYFAATKTLILISFVHYAVSAAFAHRFSEAHYSGQSDKLEAFISDAIRWTFWPSLVFALILLALGKPILMLFGAGFADGYPLLFILVLGLLARASVGPAERLLIMVGQQRLCAAIYAASFVINLVLCFTLVPRIGLMGAAASTATALIVESILLFVMARRRLGLHLFFWGR